MEGWHLLAPPWQGGEEPLAPSTEPFGFFPAMPPMESPDESAFH